jgi:hypothetical protein
MSIEENKAVVRGFTDAVWRDRDYEAIDRYFSPEYADEEIPGDPREGLKQFFSSYFAGRPDFRVVGNELTAEDDRVVQYLRGAFTNANERLGPVSAAMDMREINIFTLKDGQIVSRVGIGRSAPATAS